MAAVVVISEGVGGSVGADDFAMVDAYLAGLEDTTGMEQLLREQFRPPRACYIDDCGQPATHVWHSYPDDVVLCERHGRGHRPGLLEKRCTGAGCELCRG